MSINQHTGELDAALLRMRRAHAEAFRPVLEHQRRVAAVVAMVARAHVPQAATVIAALRLDGTTVWSFRDADGTRVENPEAQQLLRSVVGRWTPFPGLDRQVPGVVAWPSAATFDVESVLEHHVRHNW